MYAVLARRRGQVPVTSETVKFETVTIKTVRSVTDPHANHSQARVTHVKTYVHDLSAKHTYRVSDMMLYIAYMIYYVHMHLLCMHILHTGYK
jgi:hypothetical protein